jgi:hypothetical protein
MSNFKKYTHEKQTTLNTLKNKGQQKYTVPL